MRYIAHLTIEAKTPLKIGGGEDFITDLAVIRDFNELPFIPATSIAGVLRKAFDGDVDEVFGNKNGSKVIFSNALLLDENSRVVEELIDEKSEFLKLFDELIVREHTAINDRGVVKEHSKFDEEVVFRGSRFKFSIEVIDDEESFKNIIKLVFDNSFRLGGGSTKGFGKFEVIEVKAKKFDTNEYINYDSSLNFEFEDEYNFSNEFKNSKNKNFIEYRLIIKPDDFFIFSSGYGDKDADLIPVLEESINYKTKSLTQKEILIPASSIKGAISHRVAFKWNKKIGATIENNKGKIGEENEAVRELFGNKKDNKIQAKKGRVLFSDCYKSFDNETKIFDHVKIDRFTGGAIEGALFQEKVIAKKDEYEIEILVDKNVDSKYLEIFEEVLKDIATSKLGLGGMNAKGHGFFRGKVLKDGREI